MWIRKVVARAFGPFDGEELELSPGMNVICGPNEAGKSTWHGALYAALCGMRRGRGAMRTEDREFRERHSPWHQSQWEVSAEVVLSDGRALELFHDLDGKVDSRITDLGTGDDISSAYMFDGAPDGSALLGLTRDIVPSTIFVRQADILAVTQNAGALQEQLQRAAATSGRDATAEEALRLIDTFRRENVGTEIRTSTKPLRSAMVEVERCKEALESAREEHAEYVQLLQEAQDAETAAEVAVRKLRVARALEAREELEELSRRLTAAEEIKAGLPSERPPESHRLAVEAVELRNALSAFRERPDSRPMPEGRPATAIAAELEDLPERPAGDIEVHTSVATALDWLKDRKSALESARADPVSEPESTELHGTSPSELRRLAEQIETELPDVDPALVAQLETARAAGANPLTGPLGIAGAAALLVGLGLLVAGLSLAGVGVLLLGVLLVAIPLLLRDKPTVSATELQTRVAYQQEARRHAEAKRQKAEGRVQELGFGSDPEGLRRLARTAESAEADRARYAKWQTRVQQLELDVENAEGNLRTALRARGVANDGPEVPVEELVEQYTRECRQRSGQASQAGRRGDLEAELKARQEVERAWEERQRQREDLEERLTAALGAVEVKDVEPDELLRVAEEWLKEHQAQEERNREARERWSKLEGVLQGATIESLQAEVEALRENLPPLPEDWSEEEASTLSKNLARLEGEAAEAARRASELRGRAKDRAENIDDVALAEEEYEKAQLELERVRQLDRILERTHEFLSEARDQVQRAIAPRLKTAVERHLPEVTGGRYSEVIVNGDTLSVQVKDARGHWRDAGFLSHGTTEQVYLLLRAGLAEFIATTIETAPLILDDVTVQCDSTRTVAILDMLLELSEERQVVLFSQEQEVLDWARAHIAGDRDALMELPLAEVPA